MLDGAPIVVIAPFGKSSNRKTGAMLQTYILRADRAPIDAVRTGHDESICGQCPARGLLGTGRVCYVDLSKSPTTVYRAFHRGRYAPLDPLAHGPILRGRPVRRGTYGDPAAVPEWAWAALDSVAGRTGKRSGYSHQWREASAQHLRAHAMASCDSPADRAAAKAAGWRTFRVRAPTDPLLPGEIVCPASEEGGKRTTCDRCGLCNGAGARKASVDIAIIAHGIGRWAFVGAPR